jgi:hypothetical protein
MPYRVCIEPGCPTLIDKAEGKRCKAHRATFEKRRGTKTERGYGAEHQRERRRLAPIVARGRTRCSRCGELIRKGSAWVPDHNEDRTGYRGASHAECNNSAAGLAAHGMG